MILQPAQSGDQFGVNFNWHYVLLQAKENSDEYAEARIKLSIDDVDALIIELQHYRDKVKTWRDSVGPQRESESKTEYHERILRGLPEIYGRNE